MRIIRGAFNGRRTQITEYELFALSVSLRSKTTCNAKLWDYVGDCILEEEIARMSDKQNAMKKRRRISFVLSGGQEGGDHYSEAMIRSLLSDISIVDYIIV